MAKTLYIVRHAKASQDKTGIRDWERPLLNAGIERANKVSSLLKQKKIVPGKIISSHALRALNTALLFAVRLEYPLDQIEISNDIYEKEPKELLDLIKEQKDDTSSLMIFGHNPEFTALVAFLSGDTSMYMNTSAVACLEFETGKWSKIQPKTGKILFLETGK